MKHTEKCHCCGHTETVYTFNMNAGMCQALAKVAKAYEASGEPVELKVCGLTNSQYGNIGVLARFGLAKNFQKKWLPTRYGMEFLKGEAQVFSKLKVFKKKVLDASDPLWGDGVPQAKSIREFDPEFNYKQKEEYQAEKSPQTSLI